MGNGQIYSIVCAVRDLCSLSSLSRLSSDSSVSHCISRTRRGQKDKQNFESAAPRTTTPSHKHTGHKVLLWDALLPRGLHQNSSPLQARANTSHKRSVKGGGPTASIRWGRRSRRGGSSHFSHQAQFGSESAILGLPFTRALPRHVGAVVARSTVRAVRAIRAAASGGSELECSILAEGVVCKVASTPHRVLEALVGAQHGWWGRG